MNKNRCLETLRHLMGLISVEYLIYWSSGLPLSLASNLKTSPGLVHVHRSHHQSPHLFKAMFSVYAYKWQTRTVVTAGKLQGKFYIKWSIFNLNISTCLWSQYVHHFHPYVALTCSNTTVWLTWTLYLPENKLNYIFLLMHSCWHWWCRVAPRRPKILHMLMLLWCSWRHFKELKTTMGE